MEINDQAFDSNYTIFDNGTYVLKIRILYLKSYFKYKSIEKSYLKHWLKQKLSKKSSPDVESYQNMGDTTESKRNLFRDVTYIKSVSSSIYFTTPAK